MSQIDKAYRQASANNPKRQHSRDVVSFPNLKIKAKILNEACCRGSFHYNNQPVLVLQALSAETLTFRQAMKPITNKLTEVDQRYRWASQSTLQVNAHRK